MSNIYSIALILLSLGIRTDDPVAIVDKAHAYFVEQFENLAPTKFGRFGTSRIETTKIKGHFREGGVPAKASGPSFTVTIYGNRGKPIDSKLEKRYSMWRQSTAKDSPLPNTTVDKITLLRAFNEFNKKNVNKYVVLSRTDYVDIRPIRLSKRECLNCHTGMRQGDIVALSVYAVASNK